MRTFAATIALFVAIAFAVTAQPFRLPEPSAPTPPLIAPTPQQAYEQLLTVPIFAFGAIGYGAVTSPGEIAYRSIAASTNALVLFSAALTNGNAQAKIYALCGIRQFAPHTFDAQAKPVLVANPTIEMMRGCIMSQVSASSAISSITNGAYDYIKKPK